MCGYVGEGVFGICVCVFEIDIVKSVVWKDGIVDWLMCGVGVLFKKSGVCVLYGEVCVIDGKIVEVVSVGYVVWIGCEYLLFVIGFELVELLLMLFGGYVVLFIDVLLFVMLLKWLVVVGVGYIGFEFGIVYCKFGVDVSVVEVVECVLFVYDVEFVWLVVDLLVWFGVWLWFGYKVFGFDKYGVVCV